MPGEVDVYQPLHQPRLQALVVESGGETFSRQLDPQTGATLAGQVRRNPGPRERDVVAAIERGQQERDDRSERGLVVVIAIDQESRDDRHREAKLEPFLESTCEYIEREVPLLGSERV